MLYELRITARGGGADMRAVGARFGDQSVGGGVFRTEVGEAGQTVIIWPRVDPAVEPGGARRGEVAGEGGEEGGERLARNPLGKHTMEVLRLAPFMEAPEPRQIGRVWELRWYDYPAGSVDRALDAFEQPSGEAEGFPIVGCWTVETGLNLDRIYLLAAYRDWDHRDEVTSKLVSDAHWPPLSEPQALAGGARLLIPTATSPFR
jgi:hypothetical protein